MDKLFTVTVAFQYVIAANGSRSALAVADKHLREAFNDTGRDDLVMKVEDFTLPPGWDGDCFPYGGVGDLTIKDHLEDE